MRVQGSRPLVRGDQMEMRAGWRRQAEAFGGAVMWSDDVIAGPSGGCGLMDPPAGIHYW